MTRTKHRLIFVTLLSLVVLPASALIAQGPGGPGFGGPGFAEPGLGRPFLGERLAAELGLSDGQKAEIEALREAHREEMEPLWKQARESRQAVGELMRSDEFDESAVRSAARAAADLQVEMMVTGARHRNEINSVLTPEQQAKAAELREKWKERRQEFDRAGRGFERGGRRPFGRGSGRGPGRGPGTGPGGNW